MAESAIFSLATKILSTITSPAFEKAYEKGLSIWEAKYELVKLRVTIKTIQAVLLDAEKQQQNSAAVKNWIKRLKSVLYDAEDLFDEVLTNDLLKQDMLDGTSNKLSLKKQVRVSCSRLNPIISRNSIAKKVKAIRESLLEISTDMAGLRFVSCVKEGGTADGVRRGRDPGCFVDAKAVIGRDEDKRNILEMLFNELDDAKLDVPVVIAIVGIGGMGKTTLSQLIYNDALVKENFDKRWFACISDTSDEREVLGKIFESISGGKYHKFNVSQLQIIIDKAITGKKYLLVLDDVWDDHRGRWVDRMSLLSSGAKGSRIIITTRLPSVVNAVDAVGAQNLEGLSEDDSWYLFKKLAFVPGYENDPRRESLGKEILKRCRRVPLAIWSIGSLLFEKNAISEWEAIEKESLPTLGDNYNDETMSVLKLSCDHLSSNLKQCFAYCSLFPKDHCFSKRELIYLWIAQGYIEPNNEESNFMHLLRRGFFQEAIKDDFGEVQNCKMHDIMHDLAIYVAGEESIVLSGTSSNASSCTRHVNLVCDSQKDESWDIPALLLNINWLRSFMLMEVGSNCSPRNLNQLYTNFKLLRTLSLSGMRIESISSSIGELKLMRYLDLSYNDFEELPDSMTSLVNLLALNVMCCSQLKMCPKNIHKLSNLRYFNIERCIGLKNMPLGIGELTRLQYLSDLKVGKGSELDALAELLQQLRGKLLIDCRDSVEEDWDGEECSWKLPVSLQQLVIWSYSGTRIPNWGNNGIGRTNNLACLELGWCVKVKYLPSLKCLPNLKWLLLEELWEIEFLEDGSTQNNVSSVILPCLEKLSMQSLPKLKGWWRKVATTTSAQLPLLSKLSIYSCPELELKSFPLCPQLRSLQLHTVDDNTTVIQPEWLSTPKYITIDHCKWLSRFQDRAFASLRCLKINKCCSLKSLQVGSPQLQEIEISCCNVLIDFEVVNGAVTSLRVLKIRGCKQLKTLQIVGAHLNVGIERLTITDCPKLVLWELDLGWDSFSNLKMLDLDPPPSMKKLPHWIRHRRSLGLLAIVNTQLNPWSDSDEEEA